MAGRRRASGSSVVALCLLLVALVGCGGGPVADTARDEVQRLLDRRAAAVLGRDEGGYRRTGSAAGFAAVRALPLADWSYRVTGLHRTAGRATADAELRYRIDGFDKAPVTARRTVELTRGADGRWSVTSDRPAPQYPEQLWDRGAVTVVRGAHTLVLGAGQSQQTLRAYADLGDRAVPAVSRAWGTEWSGRVVVLVPESLEAMAALLASPASSYRGIAAVTTGETGAPRAPADRIIVNPEAYGALGADGKQVVLTHETTHVATRAHTGTRTPLWLSEGYADWVGYRDSGRAPAEAAPELARAVAAGNVPSALPDDAAFGFSGDATALAEAYEGGWLACRLIAQQWGEGRLGEFYRAAGANGPDTAMTDVLGTSPREFTRLWREYLRAELA
ncbi:hypothetical protein ACIHCM_00985 [Streptomyces sp. NPDC052023]|uniref:hypothetical protein n=1 Tax=Streptomyces sp. NPDC052023 TaxID=3365681 RepID=UPI0037D3BE47